MWEAEKSYQSGAFQKENVSGVRQMWERPEHQILSETPHESETQ